MAAYDKNTVDSVASKNYVDPAGTLAKSKTSTAAAPTITKVSTVTAAQSTYDSMIAQGYSIAAALSSARYAGQAVQAGVMSAGAQFTSTGQTVAGTNPIGEATTAAATGSGNGGGGGGGGATGTTTARAQFEASLRALGIPDSLIQSSLAFLESVDEATGLGKSDPAALIDIYINNKTFTTKSGTVLTSPFYTKYTSLTEGTINPVTDKPYTGKEAFAWRTGMENKISQYGFSPLFATDDSFKKLAKNGVSVDDFEIRMQQAKLAEATADPKKIAALQKLGYIGANGGAKDFYLNAEIGQKQFEENRRIAAFATENLRFADKGLQFDAARFKQISAMYGLQTETQAAETANKLYAGVAENLQQTVALSGMYDRPTQTAAETTGGIQTSLENELLLATPSEVRTRVSESNKRAFQGKAGIGQGALGNRLTTGLI